jgi:hypothetical protein
LLKIPLSISKELFTLINFMSRYRGPKLRITRRLGTVTRFNNKKSNVNQLENGNANADTGKKFTEYGVRLEEK